MEYTCTIEKGSNKGVNTTISIDLSLIDKRKARGDMINIRFDSSEPILPIQGKLESNGTFGVYCSEVPGFLEFFGCKKDVVKEISGKVCFMP